MNTIRTELLAQTKSADHPVILSIGAEQLNDEDRDKFDLIYSVNVMEHILPLEQSVAGMANVLKPDGTMVHICPNYHFPYEPHLRIPLLPFKPSATRHIFSSAVKKNQELWDTLNFITASKIRRLAKDNHLEINFRKGVMGGFFKRLRTDPAFAERHKGMIGKLAKAPVIGGILAGAFQIIPASLATPMIVTLKHKKSTTPA